MLITSNNAIIHLFTDLNLNVISGDGHVEVLAGQYNEIWGKSLLQLFTGVSARMLYQIKQECLAHTGSSRELEAQIGINGSARYYRWVVCSRQNVHGLADGLIWMGTEHNPKCPTSSEAAMQQSILDALSESVVTMDPQFRITGMNVRAIQLFGIFPETAIGTRISNHLNMRMLNEDYGHAMDTLQTTGRWQGTYVFEKEGKAPIFVSGKMLRMQHMGITTGYVAIDRDITQEMKLQQEKEEKGSERQMLEAIINQSGALCWVTGKDGRKVFVNDPFRHAYGLQDHISAPMLRDIFPPVAAKRYQHDNKLVIEERKILNKVESYTHANAKTSWYRTLKFPVVTNGGIYAAGFAYDITTEYNQDRELAYLKQRFEIAASITADIIVDWDIAQDRIWRSDPLAGIAVHQKKARKMQDRLERLHPNDKQHFTTSLDAALQSGGSFWRCEYRYAAGTIKNGYKTLSEHAHIIRNSKGTAIRMISVIKDVTEKRRLEQELRLKEKEVIAATIEGQEAERKELAGELHDNVGQILAMCKLFVDIAADAAHHEYMDKCRDHLQKAMQEIRSLSHRLSPELPDRKGLPSAIKSLAENLNQTNKIAISLHFDPVLYTTELGRTIQTAAYRIVQELISNILKHAQASKATINLWQEEATLKIGVTDDGKGFDPHKVKSGIGLRNIHNRAEVAGGDVAITSAPGKGTQTLVTLPCTCE